MATEEEKKYHFLKYKCPYCSAVNVTKKQNPLQCPQCHSKYKKKKPEIIKEVEV
jgi:DNA-directed RNA polymerase subunit RPC12/RpoP